MHMRENQLQFKLNNAEFKLEDVKVWLGRLKDVVAKCWKSLHHANFYI